MAQCRHRMCSQSRVVDYLNVNAIKPKIVCCPNKAKETKESDWSGIKAKCSVGEDVGVQTQNFEQRERKGKKKIK